MFVQRCFDEICSTPCSFVLVFVLNAVHTCKVLSKNAVQVTLVRTLALRGVPPQCLRRGKGRLADGLPRPRQPSQREPGELFSSF